MPGPTLQQPEEQSSTPDDDESGVRPIPAGQLPTAAIEQAAQEWYGKNIPSIQETKAYTTISSGLERDRQIIKLKQEILSIVETGFIARLKNIIATETENVDHSISETIDQLINYFELLKAPEYNNFLEPDLVENLQSICRSQLEPEKKLQWQVPGFFDELNLQLKNALL
jgi:hypothetical protein